MPNCQGVCLTGVPVRGPATRSLLNLRRPSHAAPVGAAVPPGRSLPGHGAEASALLAFPWATTPIGPVDSWPDNLHLLVQVMLSSEFPMMIAWGPEYTQLYNAAFRPILGTDKHPGALGRSARETWAEIWDDVGPLFAGVFAGEAVSKADHRLVINRNGYDEETYFTYSYSPIHDDSGLVAGLLVVATETTAQVVDRRRLRCMGRSRTCACRGHIDRVGHKRDHRGLEGLRARHCNRDRRRR